MSDRRLDILDAVASVVPDELKRYIQRTDICVLATRVGYDVCRYFGIKTLPVTVRTIAFNEKWRRFADEHGFDSDNGWAEPEPEGWQNDAWKKALADGAHSVAVVEGTPKPGRYAGHLVLLAPGDPVVMLDLSVRQFSRPDRGMEYGDAVVLRLAEGQLEEGVVLATATEPPAYVAYRLRPEAPDYRRGTDWRLGNPVSGRAIRRMKSRFPRTSEARR